MVNEGKKNSFRSRGFDCFKMMMVGKWSGVDGWMDGGKEQICVFMSE
jgi:hypothetical protein